MARALKFNKYFCTIFQKVIPISISIPTGSVWEYLPLVSFKHGILKEMLHFWMKNIFICS